MTTREKIIVCVMCLTIVYGAYELVGSGRSHTGSAPVANGTPKGELESFVTEITGKLVEEKVSQNYQHMILQAGTDWTKDPFIHSTEPLKKRPGPDTSSKRPAEKKVSPGYVYSGFMQLGQTKLAIINGIEYAIGEKLPDKRHYVKSISENRVVIGKVNSPETFQVYITETDSFSGI